LENEIVRIHENNGLIIICGDINIDLSEIWARNELNEQEFSFTELCHSNNLILIDPNNPQLNVTNHQRNEMDLNTPYTFFSGESHTRID